MKGIYTRSSWNLEFWQRRLGCNFLVFTRALPLGNGRSFQTKNLRRLLAKFSRFQLEGVYTIFCFLALVFTGALPAVDSFKPNEFAFASTVMPKEEAAVQYFAVPDHVYQNVSSIRLFDIRLFSSKGAALPFEIMTPQDQGGKAILPLPFFPILESGKGENQQMAIDLKQDKDGNILSVYMKGQPGSVSSSQSYLLDLKDLNLKDKERPITRLFVNWKGKTDQIFHVTISASHDLQRWSEVASGTLLKLSYQGQTIEKSAIDVHISKKRYLRLVVNTNEKLNILEISAEYETAAKKSNPDQIVKLEPIEKTPFKTAYEYDTEGVFPMHAFQLLFGSQNFLADATLSSRASSKDKWVSRYKGAVYSLSMMGTTLDSGFNLETAVRDAKLAQDLELESLCNGVGHSQMVKGHPTANDSGSRDCVKLASPTAVSRFKEFSSAVTDRFWKVEISDPEIKFQKAPIIEFKWQRHTVRFLSQEDAPYILAYGNALLNSIPSTGINISSLVNESTLAKVEAQVGEPQEIKGKVALEKVKAPIAWRIWALWAILLLAVGLVALMALKLIKEMQAR